MLVTRQIWRDGLWRNNAGLVQLLGLCPLLAVSSHLVYALGLGLATIAVLCLSNLIVSLIARFVRPEIRIAAFVVVIASAVTAVELIVRAWLWPLHQALGIFLPLIVTNCAIMGRAEAFASRNPPRLALIDGLATGIGFALVLVAVGALRELLGLGSLMARSEAIFGVDLSLRFGDGGLLLMLLPPGAFLALAVLVAAHRAWEKRRPTGVLQTQGQ